MNERERLEAERAEVIRTQQLRWKFLLAAYRHYNKKEVAAGRVPTATAAQIGHSIGLVDETELSRVTEYLKDAGLLEFMGFGPVVLITTRGINEVEDAYREPEKGTAHLPPMSVIYNVIHGGVHGSTVQQGASHSQQTVDNSQAVDWDGLRAILRDVRASAAGLPDDQRAEVLIELDTIEAQSRSANPKRAVIGACLTSLKALLANTAGNIAAAPLIQWMQAHHWLFQ